jgi:hypothetical protein
VQSDSRMIVRFSKPLGQLTEDDLRKELLGKVAEGVYAEFKSDWPEELAKHFAAFANSYGGNLFIGVKADEETNLAKELPGIPLKKDLPDRVRDKVIHHSEPVPLFSTFPIKLKASKKCVLLIKIEEGDEPPYLTGDGRIYERNPGSSDPVPIRERLKIDLLYQKRDRTQNEFNQMVGQTYWRVRFPPEPRYRDRTDCSQNILMHRAMIVSPTIVRAELFRDFFGATTRDMVFKAFDRHSVHGGPRTFAQDSIRIGKLPKTEDPLYEFTEIYRSGLVENFKQTRRPPNEHVLVDDFVCSGEHVLKLSEELYCHYGYFGNVYICFGLSGFSGRKSSTKIDALPASRNWAEIERRYPAFEVGQNAEFIMNDIKAELERVFEHH